MSPLPEGLGTALLQKSRGAVPAGADLFDFHLLLWIFLPSLLTLTPLILNTDFTIELSGKCQQRLVPVSCSHGGHGVQTSVWFPNLLR